MLWIGDIVVGFPNKDFSDIMYDPDFYGVISHMEVSFYESDYVADKYNITYTVDWNGLSVHLPEYRIKKVGFAPDDVPLSYLNKILNKYSKKEEESSFPSPHPIHEYPIRYGSFYECDTKILNKYKHQRHDGSFGDVIFRKLIDYREIEMISEYLKDYVEPESTPKKSVSGLYSDLLHAIKYNHTDIAMMMVASGKLDDECNTIHDNDWNIMVYSAECGNLEMIEYIKNNNISCGSEEDIMLDALRYKNPLTIEVLMKYGMKIPTDKYYGKVVDALHKNIDWYSSKKNTTYDIEGIEKLTIKTYFEKLLKEVKEGAQ